jgi:hypothetical protein
MESESPDRCAVRRTRKPDLCWEALVRETAANPDVDRMRLNVALKAIRSAAAREGFADDAELAREISLRAQAYRRVMNGCTLTPLALARHWYRVMVPLAPQPTPLTKQQIAFQQARMGA